METEVAVGTKFMLEVNAAAILRRLRDARRASVSELAKQTGLSRQAVTRSLSVLESTGLVEISAPDRAASPAGRPPQMVRFRAEAGHVLSVDVQPRHVRLVVADLAGDVTADAGFPVNRASSAALAESLSAAVTGGLERAGLRPADVWHVTAAAPGIVDPATGHVTLSVSMPEAVGGAIVDGIRAAVGAAVAVDNDIKLATKGERWRGTPHAEQALVFVDWGERIGAGIVLHGELYRGASNDAGDLGYLDVTGLGTVADDQDLGPFERWVGRRELLRIAAREGGLPEPPALPELAAAAASGTGWALAAIREISGRFAKGIAAIRALLDPEVIVIGGDLAVLGPALLDALADALRSERLNQPRLEISTLGPDAIVLGAIHHSLSWVERERLETPALMSQENR
ncbi:ROK family transcriptional regulator [Paractinoplanes globisporus]|uniref:ROK family transcriptional regulator n=1 Tax=Paractinoplanes globisporus TaxID=113565 RepID=A0ABW6W8G2_9ACTN|nr:ROK family protein [Actinoplanes globisporus]